MEEYKFGGGEDLYHLTMEDWERKVIHTYPKEGVDRSHLCSTLIPNLPKGYVMEIHPYGEWIPWSGGGCPVLNKTKLDIKHRVGDVRKDVLGHMRKWSLNGGGSDITHYRLAVKEERQTGRTTEQIKNAPKGSYYVTRDFKHTNYITELCISLSRTDIKIVSSRWLDALFRGTESTATVIIDHAVELTPQQSENLKRFDKPEVGKHDDHLEPLFHAYDAWIKGGKEIKTGFSVDNDTNSGNMDTQFKQQEEIQMTTRNLMTATLIDNDKGLEIDQSLVYSTEVMVEGSDTQTSIQELIFTDVVLGESIAEHNKKRTKTVNLEVLERTGQEVFLRPKKISELTWSVK